MAKNQHLKDFAKKLVTISLDADGQASDERVKAVLEALAQDPPREHKLLLKLYAKFLEVEINRGRARVEYAGPISDDVIAGIEKKFTAEYNRKVVAEAKENPKLIAGVRVTVGDDVYDSSVASRLATLEHNVA
ncbi:MAG: F0F1 ATP synthase subunit delta [Puniceicoccales bacterium]